MDIKNMTDAEKRKRIEELKKQIIEVQQSYDYNKAMQLALKLVLNGSYGAFCHPAFVISNTNIANAITALAREVINFMLDGIEDYFYNNWGTDEKIHELLGVVYISTKDDKFFIHRRDGKLIDPWGYKTDDQSPGVQKILETYQLSTSDYVENDVENFDDYEVLHKVFIYDFTKATSLDTSYSIDPISTSRKFDETRGVRTVPIIIYGDTDSLYISFSPLMESCGYDGDELKFILHMNGVFVKFMFRDMLEDYAKIYNVKSLHDFELETINKSALHIQKKHYINNVVWEDGVFYEDLSHFYPKGVEIVKSSTPAFVRENIWDFIKYLFQNPGNVNIREILKMMKNLKKQFMLADIEDISLSTSCSNYEQKIIDDQSTVEYVKGAHFSVKAAALHNYLLNKNPEFKTRIDLIRGGRIKYYYCKHDMGARFAYMRSFHPNEIVVKEGVEVDYDELFAKTFLSIANRFIEPIGLPTINKRIRVLNSIFSSKIEKKKKKKVEIEEEIDQDEPQVISSDDCVVEEVDEMLVDEMYASGEVYKPEFNPVYIKKTPEIIEEVDDEENEFDDFWE